MTHTRIVSNRAITISVRLMAAAFVMFVAAQTLLALAAPSHEPLSAVEIVTVFGTVDGGSGDALTAGSADGPVIVRFDGLTQFTGALYRGDVESIEQLIGLRVVAVGSLETSDVGGAIDASVITFIPSEPTRSHRRGLVLGTDERGSTQLLDASGEVTTIDRDGV